VDESVQVWKRRVCGNGDSTINPPQLFVNSSTLIFTLAPKHRILFSIDISPSMARVDSSGVFLFDSIFESLETVITSITSPISFDGARSDINPHIYISIIAQGSLVGEKDGALFRVLLHGALVNEDNRGNVLCNIRKKLFNLENIMAQAYHRQDGFWNIFSSLFSLISI